MTQLSNSSVSVETEITDGNLAFGVELKNYQSNDCKFDHFTLEYLGDGTATGIDEAPATSSISRNTVGVYYDLTGRRLARMTKGLHIVDGQKRVVK